MAGACGGDEYFNYTEVENGEAPSKSIIRFIRLFYLILDYWKLYFFFSYKFILPFGDYSIIAFYKSLV